MADLLSWMFSVFGFTYIVVYSKITFRFRDWCYKVAEWLGQLMSCPLCLGFWVGLIGHFTMISPTQNFLFDACLGAISAWVGTLAIADLQRKFEKPSCKKCGS